jgi:hypothetical protein
MRTLWKQLGKPARIFTVVMASLVLTDAALLWVACNPSPERVARAKEAMEQQERDDLRRSVQEPEPGIVYVDCEQVGCGKALAEFSRRYRDELQWWQPAGSYHWQGHPSRNVTGFYFMDTRKGE